MRTALLVLFAATVIAPASHAGPPYVDATLPQVIRKVPAAYPPAARRDRIEGTVVVQALVGKEGRVRETKITHSVPALDAAAVRSVRRFVFKPAVSNGKPVAVWVAVPVRFSLR